MIPDWGLVALTVVTTLGLYYGVLKPSGIIGPRIDPQSLPGVREKHIAEMECELGLCEHPVVDGEHAQKIMTSQGQQYWRLSDGRIWKVDTPCPFQ